MTEKEKKKYASAYLKNLRTSPVKLNKLANGLRKKKVADAMKILTFCNLKIASSVKSLLKSAMTNAENNNGLDIDNLVICRIDVGKSFVMKRSRARAKGRGARISKPFCHLRIVLMEEAK